MIQWILKNIVCHTFEKEAPKGARFDNPDGPVPALHIAWDISPYSPEEYVDEKQAYQYKRIHMIICGPCNYVYVATQEEVIDMEGEQSFGPLTIIGYHDSCWRDAVDRFIHENSRRLSQARSSEGLMDWYDALKLSKEEVDYLSSVEHWRRNLFTWKGAIQPDELIASNPIMKRWVR